MAKISSIVVLYRIHTHLAVAEDQVSKRKHTSSVQPSSTKGAPRTLSLPRNCRQTPLQNLQSVHTHLFRAPPAPVGYVDTLVGGCLGKACEQHELVRFRRQSRLCSALRLKPSSIQLRVGHKHGTESY